MERDTRTLADSEVKAIIEALDSDLKLMVETLVLTGMRTSELFGLKSGRNQVPQLPPNPTAVAPRRLTVLSEEGATAFETRDQAGHAKIETTMAYVRPSLERK